MIIRRLFIQVVLLGTLGQSAVGCSGSSRPASRGPSPAATTLNIVAAQNFWGSIVSQLAGRAARVTSIVSDPNIDPHSYQSSSDNARAFATADYVVLNGAGYDSWAGKLLAGNPNTKRKVTVVAAVMGKSDGDNPHLWYDPTAVTRVADRVEADLKALYPGDSSYFSTQRQAFDQASKPYRDRLAAIRTAYAGTSVGATESIFSYLADYLGLRVVSPPQFMKAVAEGNDPPAATVGVFQDQITTKQVKVLVYNLQTATSVTSNLKQLAASRGIPTVGITETVQPPDVTFEQWQTAELAALQDALSRATGPGTAPTTT